MGLEPKEELLSLALQAIRYMIWLHVFVGLMMLVLFGMSPDRVGFSPFISILATVGVLYVFSIGLRREYVSVAIVFFLFCIFDLFGALAGGLYLMNLVNLADAVLSFVAICGIVIWFRDRATTENPARVSGVMIAAKSASQALSVVPKRRF